MPPSLRAWVGAAVCGVHLCQGVWVGGHTLSFHSSRWGAQVPCGQDQGPGAPGRAEGAAGAGRAPATWRCETLAGARPSLRSAPFSSKLSSLKRSDTQACVSQIYEGKVFIYKLGKGKNKSWKRHCIAVLTQPLAVTLMKRSVSW